jgi:hypothetical protein
MEGLDVVIPCPQSLHLKTTSIGSSTPSPPLTTSGWNLDMYQVVLDAWSRFAFSYLTRTEFDPKDWGVFMTDEPVLVDSKQDMVTK